MATTQMYNLEINSAYNIPMLVPAILGTGYNNAVIDGIINFNDAIKVIDVTAIHASILSALPTGTPSDASKLIYIKFITETGQTQVVAQDWIASQPVLVSSTTVNLTISNINTADIPRLMATLQSNGFNASLN